MATARPIVVSPVGSTGSTIAVTFRKSTTPPDKASITRLSLYVSPFVIVVKRLRSNTLPTPLARSVTKSFTVPTVCV